MKKQPFKKSGLTKKVMNSLLGGVTDPNDETSKDLDKKNPIPGGTASPTTSNDY